MPALLQARPIALCPKPMLARGSHTHIKGIAPSKSFQLLGSFEAPNPEFKLEKVQLAVGIAFGSGVLLTGAIKIIESHALHRELTAERVRITVPGELVFACFSLILVSLILAQKPRQGSAAWWD